MSKWPWRKSISTDTWWVDHVNEPYIVLPGSPIPNADIWK